MRGWIGSGFNLFSTILLTQVMRREKLFGARRLLLFSAMFPGFLFIALAFLHVAAFAIPALFFLVGCKTVRIPVLNEYINRCIESETRATVISLVLLLERSVTSLLYPLVGLLADVSLDYALLLLGSVAILFAITTRLREFR